ncbi:hypothetical protein BD410DRAFT_578022 [Rickenella mellea]|uniref:Glycoside hydrolase 35 catalytic domain-containing protein n=1 Tax=Rickenella mellea TaxID=50990 RepID=A0A4Y7QHH1_9AGAM|nr:hypothetical protein BD410DRAFT_578022 [Rickenella mellea]
MKLKFIAALLALACSLHPAVSQGVPAGSPGFFQGNSTAAVTFDANSLFIDGQRVMIFSGEFHPWRLPVPQLWSDVLQKMKAAGFNAASVYFNWALVEGTPGSLDWNYFRSLTDFYEVAKRVGIFIICRPGPYINGETAGGGFPGWLTNVNATARTNATLFTNAWNAYMTQFAQQTAPYQYPDGPVIAVQSENEFDTQTLHRPYMILLENNLRANGITKVPLTHNDKNAGGQYSGGAGAVDL